jgi:flagellar basal-body rod protein FlgB
MSGALFDPSFRGIHQVLDLRMQQHALTAGNLANAETPGYRARYLDFSESLTQAMTPDPATGGPGEAEPEVIEVEPPAWSVNENSVFPEQEHARLRANAMLYNGLVSGVGRRYALLKFAASDGRG